MNKKSIISSISYSILVFILISGVYFLIIKQNIFDDLNPYKKLVKLYDEKKYQKVIELGTKLLGDHNDSVNIRRYLWKSYLVIENYNKALSILEELKILLPSDSVEVLFAHCTLYKFMKSYDIAISYCRQALIIKPDNVDLKIELAKILIEKGDLNKAKNYIKDNFDSEDFHKQLLLANIKTNEFNYTESILILEKLRLENPNEYTLYYYLANNYIHLEDYIRASSYLEEFTSSLNSESIDTDILEDAYAKLAVCYETNKMYAKAYDAYKEASCFSIKLKKTDNALKMIKKAIAISYLSYRGFVSEKDFKDKFNLLKKDLEKSCGGDLFTF